MRYEPYFAWNGETVTWVTSPGVKMSTNLSLSSNTIDIVTEKLYLPEVDLASLDITKPFGHENTCSGSGLGNIYLPKKQSTLNITHNPINTKSPNRYETITTNQIDGYIPTCEQYGKLRMQFQLLLSCLPDYLTKSMK